MEPRNVLITGANKGIGEAIVRRILSEYKDVFVILGSRDYERGVAARDRILKDIPEGKDRLQLMIIDVSDEKSVKKAAKETTEKYGSLYGIVNNAGIATGHYKDIFNVNFFGIKYVFDNFKHLLPLNSRIVNVSSAGGPAFVSKTTQDWKKVLISKDVQWEQLENIYNKYISLRESAGEAGNAFVNSKKDYGLSKALVNSYTMLTARLNPNLIINACTPGYIISDMTRSHWERHGKTPEDIGCLPVEEGTHAPCHLLFNVESSGNYYGGDCLRSPLHRYRTQGEKEYESDAEDGEDVGVQKSKL